MSKDNSLQNLSNTNSSPEDQLDFSFILRRTLLNWRYMLMGIIIFPLLAFLYTEYAQPIYLVSSKILVEDQQSSTSGASSSFGGGDLSNLLGFQSNALNEVEILKSRSLMEEVVRDLHLNIITYKKNRLVSREIFNESPFKVDINYNHSVGDKVDSVPLRKYAIEILSEKAFHIKNSDEDLDKDLPFDTALKLQPYTLFFSKGDLINPIVGQKYVIVIQSVAKEVDDLTDQYDVELSDKQATAIDLTLNYPNSKKGQVIVQRLMNFYLRSNVLNKKRIADSTLVFIGARIAIVASELSGAEKNLEQYKYKNGIADLGEQSKALITNSSEYLQKLNDMDVQLSVVNDLEKTLNSSKDKLIPSSLALSNASFATALDKYNELLLEREKQNLSYSEENPIIKNLDNQISGVKNSLTQNIASYKREMLLSKQKLTNQNNSFNSQIKTVPNKERIFLDYERQQTLKEQLYLFLLQKREETAISRTSTISNARIIDNAESNYTPIKPKKSLIIVGGLVLGLLIPFGYIHFREKLNTKIMSRVDVDNKTNIPVVGEIIHNETSENLVVTTGSRSVISEHFRNLRTNLNYILDVNKCSVIMLTSSMSGEGKTFLTLNLGSSMALSGKKVIFLELDLRKPKLSQSLGLDHNNGFSNYIVSNSNDLDSIITPLAFSPNCYLISSGPIPPNPSELLLSDKLNILIEGLKKRFDYIFIDSPPVGLISDGLLIEKYTDMTIYVVRQGYTYKDQLEIPNNLVAQNKIKKLYLAINDIDTKMGNGYYSYGYGNGYGDYIDQPDGKKWWKRSNTK